MKLCDLPRVVTFSTLDRGREQGWREVQGGRGGPGRLEREVHGGWREVSTVAEERFKAAGGQGRRHHCIGAGWQSATPAMSQVWHCRPLSLRNLNLITNFVLLY